MWEIGVSFIVTLAVALTAAYYWAYILPHPKEIKNGIRGVGTVECVLVYGRGRLQTYVPVIRYQYNGIEYINEVSEGFSSEEAGILWPGTKGKQVYLSIDPKNPNRISARLSKPTTSPMKQCAIGIIGLLSVAISVYGIVQQIVWLTLMQSTT